MELCFINRFIYSGCWLLVFFANLIYSFAKKKTAAQNPWGEGATTLEWTVPSPPNFHTFEELPKFEDPDGVEKALVIKFSFFYIKY